MLLKITSVIRPSSVNRKGRNGLGSRSGRLSLTVDISADQSLLENGQQAALSLLALGRANVDEVVDASGCGRSCHNVSANLEKSYWRVVELGTTYGSGNRGWRG